MLWKEKYLHYFYRIILIPDYEFILDENIQRLNLVLEIIQLYLIFRKITTAFAVDKKHYFKLNLYEKNYFNFGIVPDFLGNECSGRLQHGNWRNP